MGIAEVLNTKEKAGAMVDALVTHCKVTQPLFPESMVVSIMEGAAPSNEWTVSSLLLDCYLVSPSGFYSMCANALIRGRPELDYGDPAPRWSEAPSRFQHGAALEDALTVFLGVLGHDKFKHAMPGPANKEPTALDESIRLEYHWQLETVVGRMLAAKGDTRKRWERIGWRVMKDYGRDYLRRDE